MSSSLHTRGTTHNDRRTSATLGTKPRVPSLRPEAKVQLGSADDVLPQDSASNSGSRRPTSGSFKPNGSSIYTVSERQTERQQITTRDNIRTSVRNSLKHPVSDKENALGPQHREPVQTNANPAETKEKKMLRKLHSSLTVRLERLLRSTVQRHGNHRLPSYHTVRLL